MDSFFLKIVESSFVRGDSDRKFFAKRISTVEGDDPDCCCFSAQSNTDIVFVPVHDNATQHWSLMVLYRIETGLASWYAVHYDSVEGCHEEVAKRLFRCLQIVISRDIDSTVQFHNEVIEAKNVCQQFEGWSCGYRVAALAHLICKFAARDGRVSLDLAKYMQDSQGAEADLGAAACARFLAQALDAARSFELVQCIQRRLEDI